SGTLLGRRHGVYRSNYNRRQRSHRIRAPAATVHAPRKPASHREPNGIREGEALMATTLGGVEIPKVYIEETSRMTIGGSVVRAVDGTPHRTPVRVIRTWELETRPLTWAQYSAIEKMVEAAGGGAVAFHSDDWDSGIVNVFIIEFSDSRTEIPDRTAPGKNMHTVRLVLEEV